jgi:hypothetical protein
MTSKLAAVATTTTLNDQGYEENPDIGQELSQPLCVYVENAVGDGE